MTGLDDAGVDRAHGDFVNAFAFDAAKRIGFAVIGKIFARQSSLSTVDDNRPAKIGARADGANRDARSVRVQTSHESRARSGWRDTSASRARETVGSVAGTLTEAIDHLGDALERKNVTQGEIAICWSRVFGDDELGTSTGQRAQVIGEVRELLPRHADAQLTRSCASRSGSDPDRLQREVAVDHSSPPSHTPNTCNTCLSAASNGDGSVTPEHEQEREVHSEGREPQTQRLAARQIGRRVAV